MRAVEPHVKSGVSPKGAFNAPGYPPKISVKDRKCRERLRGKPLYHSRHQIVLWDGKGYEPPREHPMPFSTWRTIIAMFDPLR